MTEEKRVRATACAIIEKGGDVLLVKRGTGPFEGMWCLPGGHIDFSEKAEDAARREVKEETGLAIKNLKFMGYRDEIYPEIGWHGEVLVFLCHVMGEEKIDGEEITGIRWAALDEAMNMKLAFGHEKTLREHSQKIRDTTRDTKTEDKNG
ncbi:NUDIX hydrolase [Candidatus Woesearchaeota archaeon]|nr:NUDIX hydrolase [Candidatus Woesearchaeota archaeon]